MSGHDAYDQRDWESATEYVDDIKCEQFSLKLGPDTFTIQPPPTSTKMFHLISHANITYITRNICQKFVTVLAENKKLNC